MFTIGNIFLHKTPAYAANTWDVQLDTNKDILVDEYNGNTILLLKGKITGTMTSDVVVSATIDGVKKTSTVYFNKTDRTWSLKWDTNADDIAGDDYTNILITGKDTNYNNTATFTKNIKVQKVNPYDMLKQSILTKQHDGSKWAEKPSYVQVDIPDGYEKFGVDASYYYVYNTENGDMKYKADDDTSWKALSNWEDVLLPSGYQPLDTDGNYFYIINPKDGNVLGKKVDYTYWGDMTSFYKQVSIPSGYQPFGVYDNNIYAIENSTGNVKIKGFLDSTWQELNGYVNDMIPKYYEPFGVRGNVFILSNFNINKYNNGVENNGRFLEFALKDSTNKEVDTIQKTETTKVVFLSGNYELGGYINKNVSIKYEVYAKNVQAPIQTGTIMTDTTITKANQKNSFNKAITMKLNGTSCGADEVCLDSTGSSYYVKIYAEYGDVDNKQIVTQFNKSFKVDFPAEPYKDVLEDTQVAVDKGLFYSTILNVNSGKYLNGNEYFNRVDLKSTAVIFNIDGQLKLKNIKNKEVKIVYDIIDYDSYLNKDKNEGLIKRYTQTQYTEDNYVKFNRNMGIKVQNGDLESTTNYNLLPDENRDYALRIAVYVDDKVTYMVDTPIHVNNSGTGTPTGDVNSTYHEGTPTIKSGEKIAYTLIKNGDTTPFTTITLDELRKNRIKLNLLGAFKDSGIQEQKNIKFRYKIISIDSPYFNSKEQLIQEYEQTQYTLNNEVEFNKNIYLKSEANPEAENEQSPTIHLKDYPAKYTFMVEAVYGENEAVSVQKVVEFNVTGSREGYFTDDGDTPAFVNKTNLEFKTSKYVGDTLTEIANTETNQQTVQEILVDDIRKTPLKMQIDGTFRNKIDNAYDDISIQYDIMAFENYSDKTAVNKVIKTYTENTATEGQNLEFNRAFWISTKDRANKASDSVEGTVYLENYTQYYTVRVSVIDKTKNSTVVMRDIKVLLKATEDPYQQTDGPTFKLPDGLSGYFVNQKGNLSPQLEITARDLNNAKDGIDVDIQGFFKSNWASTDVDVNYELEALNSYKNYLTDVDGYEETLSLDYNNEVYMSDPVKYTQTTLVRPMEQWMGGQVTQKGMFKKYRHTADTTGHHESFIRKFNLRTKLDQEVEGVKGNESVLFLDNSARSYKLHIYATNKTTNEIVEKVIDLKITTVNPNDNSATNSKPEFPSGVSVVTPTSGTGWFTDDVMNIKWKPASDTDNELMYYKIYYYYNTTNDQGTVNEEIRQFINTYEDYPTAGINLSYDYTVDNPAKIEPVYIRVIACDVNHECSAPTRSAPFKFNDFGLNGGTGETQQKPNYNLQITPQPDGQWKNEDQEVSVVLTGDISGAKVSSKKYAITNSSTFPSILPNTVASDGTIQLTNDGIQYVHVTYTM